MRHNDKLMFSEGVQKQVSTDFFIRCIQRYNIWGKEILKTISFRCSLKIRGFPGGSDEEPSRLQSMGSRRAGHGRATNHTHTETQARQGPDSTQPHTSTLAVYGAGPENLQSDRKRSLKGVRGSDTDHLTGGKVYCRLYFSGSFVHLSNGG